MMFVIKGVVNLSNDEVGELAVVSYQGTNGDYRLSFFFNKEEVLSDFNVDYAEVLGILDNKVRGEIMSYDVNTYLKVTEDSLEIVDLNLYTDKDTKSILPYKNAVTECTCIQRKVRVHQFSLPDLDVAVRAKSHQKQYHMRGIKLGFHLSLENPIKYNEVDLIPVESYYADYEAMADIVNLDYTIQDYTQPLKSVVELSEDHQEQEEDYEYYDEEEGIDEVEMDIDDEDEQEPVEEEAKPPVVEPKVEEKPKKTSPKKTSPKKPTKKEKTSPTQPRTKDGKFAPKK